MELWLLAVPTAGGLLAAAIRNASINRSILVAVALVHLVLVGVAWTLPLDPGGHWLGLDELGLLLLTGVSALFLPVAIYSVGYLARRSARHTATDSLFVTCMLFFLGTMTLVTVAQQFELLWVAVEATTLASAPLIYFHHSKHAVEATWKYLIICSVGIALALLGTVFLAVSASSGGIEGLSLSALTRDAASLQPTYLRLAFVLFVVGYGTKMGLAPMHTWLPDAHSEAPSPVSALLSGASLACAFLGILRVGQLCFAAGMGDLVQDVMLFLGMVSLVVAVVYIVGQKDFKRLLAYSSVEHMGLAAVGLSLGGSAVKFALLHVVGHAFVKGMAFLAAGNLLSAFHSKRVSQVTGAISVVPGTAVMWLAALFLLAGAPPGLLFITKLGILRSALDSGHIAVALLLALLLTLAFAGLAAAMLPMALGQRPELKPKEGDDGRQRQDNWLVLAPLVALAAMAVTLGLFLPDAAMQLLHKASSLLGGRP